MDNDKEKILNFFKKYPGKCFGAVKVDNELGFEDSKRGHSGPTHKKLENMVKEGTLTRCEKGKGFKYNNTEDKKPLTKAEIDLEIKKLFENLKNQPRQNHLHLAQWRQNIKEKIEILKIMKETISE